LDEIGVKGKVSMKIFLSHSQRDAALAQKIAHGLRDEGLQVWLPEEELLPGDNWAEGISRALDQCDSMIALLTPNATQSSNVQWEMGYALGNKAYKKRVIPIVVGDEAESLLPWILERFQVVRIKNAGDAGKAVHEIAGQLLAAA
jgi:nucleoside 2-deoxyribosyltransferase